MEVDFAAAFYASPKQAGRCLPRFPAHKGRVSAAPKGLRRLSVAGKSSVKQQRKNVIALIVQQILSYHTICV